MVFACQRDSYLREFCSTVTSCQPTELNIDGKEGSRRHLFEVILDDTILFPEGGGQPEDHGKINNVPVLHVIRKADKAVHFTEEPLEPNSKVHVTVDWKRRFDHMQQHTGQHLITALAEDVYQLHTTSWNLGEEVSYIELDASTIKNETLVQLEELVNEKIRENIPVMVKLYEQGAPELSKVRTRLELPDDHVGPVRVVTIEGIDSNTCCGTHLSCLGHLQAIKFLRIEKGKKNKSNLFFVAGNRLLQYLHKCVTRESALNGILKCGPEEHIQMAEKLQKSLKLANKNALITMRDLAKAQALQLKQTKPCPKFFSLHRKDAEPEFISVFSGEVNDSSILLFLTVGEDRGAGHMLLTGPQEILEKYGGEVCNLLEGKGNLKIGRFQAKVANLAKRSKAEELLRQAVECSANITNCEN